MRLFNTALGCDSRGDLKIVDLLVLPMHSLCFFASACARLPLTVKFFDHLLRRRWLRNRYDMGHFVEVIDEGSDRVGLWD